MSVDDWIKQSVDTAFGEMRERVERDVRAIVEQLKATAAEERDHAVAATREAAFADGAADAQRQVAEAEARVRATLDHVVAEAREKERDIAANEVRRIVEIEAAQKLSDALAAAESALQVALVNAENRAAQALKDSVTAARVREREGEMAGVSRLLDSIRGLDGAASLSEVLDALGQAAGREAARAAVLVLRNDRLLGWKLSGFGPRDAQPKTIDLGLNEAGVAGLAVGSARPVTTRDSQTAGDGPGFAHLPADRMGLAVPVIVGGRVVAVVYADGASQDGREHAVPSGWPEVIEMLARHAARCLEALTVQKATTQPSPRFWVPPTSKTSAQPAGPGGAPGPPGEAETVAGPRPVAGAHPTEAIGSPASSGRDQSAG